MKNYYLIYILFNITRAKDFKSEFIGVTSNFYITCILKCIK